MTDLDLRAGQIHRGLGIVARWPDIAVVIPSDPTHDSVVDEMLENLEPNPASQTVIRAINDLLSQSSLHALGMIVEATGGPMAVAYGPVEILSDGEVLLSGKDGIAKQQLSHQAKRLTMRATDFGEASDPIAPFDLRRGIAPGAGLTLVTVAPEGPPGMSDEQISAFDEPEQQPQPDVSFQDESDPGSDIPMAVGAAPVAVHSPLDDDSLSAPFKSVLLTNVGPIQGLTPLPLAGSGVPAVLDASDKQVMVEGILCTRGHFNNPRSAYCMVCGISMLHLTPNPVTRPRPTLGFIVFDDGSSFGLDRSYVIGREPTHSDTSPDAPPSELLVIHDNNDTLSRTHAELRLTNWRVEVIDLGSTNGTYIWDGENDRWTQLVAGQAVELQSGETVALGRRTFVFEGVSPA